jgi:hypothetical protein
MFPPCTTSLSIPLSRRGSIFRKLFVVIERNVTSMHTVPRLLLLLFSLLLLILLLLLPARRTLEKVVRKVG